MAKIMKTQLWNPDMCFEFDLLGSKFFLNGILENKQTKLRNIIFKACIKNQRYVPEQSYGDSFMKILVPTYHEISCLCPF